MLIADDLLLGKLWKQQLGLNFLFYVRNVWISTFFEADAALPITVWGECSLVNNQSPRRSLMTRVTG